jgi:two-component sensor histidine kinase
MSKQSFILAKMADKILKSAELSDAFNQSKQRSDRMKRLHEAITTRYKFEVANHKDCGTTELDASFTKHIEKKLTLSDRETYKLEALFKKYRID